MYIQLDMESETPLYQQIVNRIVEGITKGSMQTGESLPSVRRLASDIGINMHTVSKSYKILQQQGYIRMHRRKGAIVAELNSETKGNPQHVETLKEMLRPMLAWAVSEGVSLNQINLVVTDVIESLYNDKGREKL